MRNLLKNKENAFVSRACTVNFNETLRTFTKQLEEKGAQGQKITQKQEVHKSKILTDGQNSPLSGAQTPHTSKYGRSCTSTHVNFIPSTSSNKCDGDSWDFLGWFGVNFFCGCGFQLFLFLGFFLKLLFAFLIVLEFSA